MRTAPVSVDLPDNLKQNELQLLYAVDYSRKLGTQGVLIYANDYVTIEFQTITYSACANPATILRS